MITYEDFEKLDIRIGEVIEAEKIPGSNNLLRLEFNFGKENRQIIAGMARFIDDPKKLIGKKIPVIINLEPKKLMGYVSQGMILAASYDNKASFIFTNRNVPPGSSVK